MLLASIVIMLKPENIFVLTIAEGPYSLFVVKSKWMLMILLSLIYNLNHGCAMFLVLYQKLRIYSHSLLFCDKSRNTGTSVFSKSVKPTYKSFQTSFI